MILVAKIGYDYNKDFNTTVDIIKDNIKKIDIFTSRFSNKNELLKFLEQTLKERISSVCILDIFLLDDDYKDPISILYSKYAFITDSYQKNLLLSKIKYLDPFRLKQYFFNKVSEAENESISNDVKDYESLLNKLESCKDKPDSKFYCEFHNFLCDDYLKRRNVALSVLSDNEINDFRKVDILDSSISNIIATKFLRRVLSIPKPKVESNIKNHNLHDEYILSNQDEFESYICSVATNSCLSFDEKISEISSFTDITPHIYELINKNNSD